MISAVIPVHNRFEYLNETIASVFSQTRMPDEVLVVDDCSTIPMEAYFAQNLTPGPVRVLRLTDRGMPEAPAIMDGGMHRVT
jgi:glycosyltransferase involved in cell wall biosynthesis